MAAQLSDEQLAECQEVFSMFDKNGDGTISVSELGIIMRKLGLSPTQAELEEFIEEIDTDGSVTYNGLNFEQFVQLMTRKVNDVFTEAEIQEAFRVFDKANNGFISQGEVKHILTSMGEKLTDEEIECLIESADVDSDGNIRYEEFVAKMMAD